MKKKSVKYGIGFADSEIVSFNGDDKSLIIILQAWNAQLLRIEFKECILFLMVPSWRISDLCEIDDSSLFQRVISMGYEEEVDEYKLYQFFDEDDDPSFEIACKEIEITIIGKRDEY